ncbi:MAG: hypothetical protein CM15mP53_06960 [Ectothiorhodospiraceae bacterium]|nr:MAG: hypothetical protein CM15mP53_06960 [Ectothiorhodospiraceae bacterium]
MLANKIRNVIDFFDTRGLDLLFLACVTSLILIGLIMVASSTVDFAATKFSNPLFFFKKHFIFIILGLLVLSIVARVRVKFYYDYGQYFLILAIILSLLVHVPGLGKTVNGATRWIDLGFLLYKYQRYHAFFLLWLSGYITRNDFDKNYLKIFFFINLNVSDRISEGFW